MHCNGSCHLKKQLEKEQKKEQNTPSGGIKDQTGLLYFYETPYMNFFPGQERKSCYFTLAATSTIDFASFVFRPPSC